jgi:hypothetical protein
MKKRNLIHILDYSEDGSLVKRPDSFDSIIGFFKRY